MPWPISAGPWSRGPYSRGTHPASNGAPRSGREGRSAGGPRTFRGLGVPEELADATGIAAERARADHLYGALGLARRERQYYIAGPTFIVERPEYAAYGRTLLEHRSEDNRA